jgi:hypothetical protein
MNSGKYNIEFILDGGATPSAHPCLKDLWRPWNSTWIKFDLREHIHKDTPSNNFQYFVIFVVFL